MTAWSKMFPIMAWCLLSANFRLQCEVWRPKCFCFFHSFKNFCFSAARVIFRRPEISIGSVNGLAPDGCQAITWTNGDSFQWCICIVRPRSGNSLTVSQAEQLPFQYNIWESIEHTEVDFLAYILAAKVWNHYSCDKENTFFTNKIYPLATVIGHWWHHMISWNSVMEMGPHWFD